MHFYYKKTINPEIQRVVKHYKKVFQYRKLDSPHLSAELIIAKNLRVSRLEILANPHRSISSQEVFKIERDMLCRAQGKPVAYILGFKEFYGLEFLVDPSVLIPRPETELIIDLIQYFFHVDSRFYFADIGTGSGILGITIALLFKNSLGLGLENTSSALKVAKNNKHKHFAKNFYPVLGDLTSCLTEDSLDLIVSNPPYLSLEQYKKLNPEIRHYEPKQALLAGTEGTEYHLFIISSIWRILRSGGYFFLEIDSSQSCYLYRLLQDYYRNIYSEIKIYKDLAGRERVLGAKKM